MTLAACLSLASLLTLGRWFGIRPALRGLATTGPYGLVRHPIYLAYLFADIGYNLQEWNPGTLALVAAGWTATVVLALLHDGTLLVIVTVPGPDLTSAERIASRRDQPRRPRVARAHEVLRGELIVDERQRRPREAEVGRVAGRRRHLVGQVAAQRRHEADVVELHDQRSGFHAFSLPHWHGHHDPGDRGGKACRTGWPFPRPRCPRCSTAPSPARRLTPMISLSSR